MTTIVGGWCVWPQTPKILRTAALSKF